MRRFSYDIKRFCNKIISKVKPSIDRVKSFPKLFAIGVISLFAVLGASAIPARITIAYAQTQLTDPI